MLPFFFFSHAIFADLLASFSYELGVPKHEQTAKDYASLKGRHKTSILEEILVQFATEVCICASCHLPETELLNNNQDKLQKRCSSCVPVSARAGPSVLIKVRCGAVALLTTRNPKLTKFIATHFAPVRNLVVSTSDVSSKEKENDIFGMIQLDLDVC